MRFYEIHDATPMTMADVLKHKKTVEKICRRYEVELCFIHGSIATHRHGPLSDVDIAIHAPTLSMDQSFKLQGEFVSLFHRDDIDLALLHRGSSLLGMQVLTKGYPLYIKHPRYLTHFRYETFRRYLDSQSLRRRFADYVMEAML